MTALDRFTRVLNGGLVAFDLALGSAALARPRETLRLLGHADPSPDAEALFRRCGPIWLTFAAGHAVAAARGESRDWWALAWLRATEIGTDALWSGSPGFRGKAQSRLALQGASAANLAMAFGFARLAR